MEAMSKPAVKNQSNILWWVVYCRYILHAYLYTL